MGVGFFFYNCEVCRFVITCKQCRTLEWTIMLSSAHPFRSHWTFPNFYYRRQERVYTDRLPFLLSVFNFKPKYGATKERRKIAFKHFCSSSINSQGKDDEYCSSMALSKIKNY